MLKSLSDISFVINARVQSTRVPHKLIRPFCDTNLLDICLKKATQLASKCTVYLAACEQEILDIHSKYNEITLLKRKPESVAKGFRDQKITFAHYLEIPTKYIFSINSCMPFTSVNLYLKALDWFVLNDDIVTMTSVKKKNNLYFDASFSPVNMGSFAVSTQSNAPIYEMAHAFHIFDRLKFMEQGYFWDYTYNNPFCFVLDDGVELLDIDTELDFSICEKIYASQIAKI